MVVIEAAFCMLWNFVVGGVAGWLLANLMELDDTAKKAEITPEEALEVLVTDIRNEAQKAMDECTTDEERELVYAQVKESVQKFQLTLQEKGEDIIVDLRSQVVDDSGKEEKEDSFESRVNDFKSKMYNLSDKLNQTLSDLNPKTAEA